MAEAQRQPRLPDGVGQGDVDRSSACIADTNLGRNTGVLARENMNHTTIGGIAVQGTGVAAHDLHTLNAVQGNVNRRDRTNAVRRGTNTIDQHHHVDTVVPTQEK